MTNELEAKPERIAEFLRMALPDGPYVLGAIPAQKGAPKVRTFGDAMDAAAWAATMNVAGAHNLYWIHNRLKGPVDRKPKEADVLEVLFLHVDCDPPKKLPREGMSPEALAEWTEQERESIVGRLTKFDPEPSFIVDSGGGFQAFWRLDQAHPVDGDETQVANLKPYNVQLRDVLGGDNCQSFDHLMRLAGTVNWPDAEKRKRGRRPRLATVIHESGEAYPLHDFTPSAEAKASGASAKVQISSNLPRIKGLDDLPASVSQRTRMLIVQGDDPDDPTKYGSKSEVMWAVTCELIRAGCEDDIIAAVLLDPDFGISDHPLRQKRSVEYVARQIERAREDNEAGGRRVLDPSDPYLTAIRLKEELLPDTIHTNDDWLTWRGGAYRDVEDGTVMALIWRELAASVVRKKKDEAFIFEPFKPGKGQVAEVMAAMEGLAHQPADAIAPPAWLDGDGPQPLEMVACRNGILHVPSGELFHPTPRFFTRNALEIDFAPDAPAPRHWEAFVEEVFPDPVAAQLLQDWFGYLLLPDISQQRILLMIGPTRSGKGVTQQIITRLVGQGNTCNPKSGSLGSTNVGALQPLIGKTVAFMSDARFGGNLNKHAIAETLLTISGGDNVTIDRKFKEAWTGRLPTRFVMLSNELPSLKDNSPALANRFVPLMFEQSFLGREDHGLVDRIVNSELPGILNWALVGWRRLHERGRFVLPAVSRDAVDQILELGSPAAHFLRDRCIVERGRSVEKDRLFVAYVDWCDRNQMRNSDAAHFGRDLIAASSNRIRPKRGSVAGERVQQYEGVDLTPTPDSPY